MTPTSKRHAEFARVIAALDASCHDVRTLATAADIAARFGVDVAGLFIEDVNLFRLAGLPLARHVAIGSARPAPLSAEQLERDMRALAAQAATELEACAVRCGVRSSFRTVRGLPTVELAAATMAEDLLVLGATREMAGLPLRLGSPLHEAADRAGRSILHTRQRMRAIRPLLVLRAGSALTPRVVAIARHFGAAESRELAVLLVGLPADTNAAAGPLMSMLAAQGYRARIREVSQSTAAQLAQAVRDGRNDVLVVAADVPGIGEDGGLEDLVFTAPCDVLVVR